MTSWNKFDRELDNIHLNEDASSTIFLMPRLKSLIFYSIVFFLRRLVPCRVLVRYFSDFILPYSECLEQHSSGRAFFSTQLCASHYSLAGISVSPRT
jgi:hypothetical protein